MTSPAREPSLNQPLPKSLGYRWPAEWEPHASTWLSWPHNPETWPGKFEPIPQAFAAFVLAVAEFEPVNLLAGGREHRAIAESFLRGASNVKIWDIPTNDAWIRDYGPTFLAGPTGAASAAVHWQYNGWGGKYPPFDLDAVAAKTILQSLGRRCFACELVVEGGAIDGNGAGVVLTTRSCLLSESRNPGYSQDQIEQALCSYLGAKKVLWLEGGPFAGDDTDGHIDQLARFVGPTTVVASVAEDSGDENHDPLERNRRALSEMTDASGKRLDVVPLPLPRPKFYKEHRLPAGYCNFYLVNGGVIVPTFGDPADDRAMDILGGLFPGRRTIGLNALDLVWGLGAFHCLSQQEPAAASV